jgi:TonB family protein
VTLKRANAMRRQHAGGSDGEGRGPSEERARVLRALLERSDEPHRPLREFAAAALRLVTKVTVIAVLLGGVWLVSRSSFPTTLVAWTSDGWTRLGGVSERVSQAFSRARDPASVRAQRALAASNSEADRNALAVDATDVFLAPTESPHGESEPGLQESLESRAGQPAMPDLPMVSPPSATSPETGIPDTQSWRARATATGAVEIRTSIAGIRVEIDGVVASRAPVRISSVPPGRHVLRVRGPHGESSQPIEVWPGQLTTVDVPAAAAAGSMAATTPVARSPLVATPPATEGPPAVPARDAGIIVSPAIPEDSSADLLVARTTPFPADEIAPAQPIDEHVPPIPMPFPRPHGSRVIVDLLIDERGRVESAIVREPSDAYLDVAVISAARRWRYQPAMRAGVPVSSTRTVEIPLSNK